jgi:hypothetical protein
MEGAGNFADDDPDGGLVTIWLGKPHVVRMETVSGSFELGLAGLLGPRSMRAA